MFSETLKGISNTLQNVRFVQSSVYEIVGGPKYPGIRRVNELVGKIMIRKPRELYAVINFIFMGLQF